MMWIPAGRYDVRKRFSAQCWRPWGRDCLSGHKPLLKLAAGGTLTMMGDAWSWHVLSGMAGLLGETSLAAHVVLQSLNQLCFPLAFSIGTACTTRVGNQLGAGDGHAAKRVVYIGMTMSVLVQVVASIVVYSQRERAAFIYTNELPVVNAVKAVAGIFFCFQFVSGLNQTCATSHFRCFRNATSN